MCMYVCMAYADLLCFLTHGTRYLQHILTVLCFRITVIGDVTSEHILTCSDTQNVQ